MDNVDMWIVMQFQSIALLNQPTCYSSKLQSDFDGQSGTTTKSNLQLVVTDISMAKQG